MIHIEHLNYAVGDFALQDVSLDVRPGEYFVLLGPSGSGKTLLLECLCGLNRLDSGRITIDGLNVTRLEPRNRSIGYLPQDYALFPDRSVTQNIIYGLQSDRQSYWRTARRIAVGVPRMCAAAARHAATPLLGPAARRASVPDKVIELLDLVGARHLAQRLPGKLSGGEQQRIALARALAVRPKVLLLDEPVSALDEQTRDRLCPELKRLQRDTQTTTIHVCHNFAEMMAVADRVGVIRQGRICQIGTPQDIVERPSTRALAEFMQAGNLFPARAEPDGPWTRLVGPAGSVFRGAREHGRQVAGEVTIMLRPENVRVERGPATDAAPGTSTLQGTIGQLTDLGPIVHMSIECGPNFVLLAALGKREYSRLGLLCGARVHLAIAPADIHILED
jgi:ABC-type Fe3+/spermidine/putrescine transport system ATPase subunit